jgi:hypothetical protein
MKKFLFLIIFILIKNITTEYKSYKNYKLYQNILSDNEERNFYQNLQNTQIVNLKIIKRLMYGVIISQILTKKLHF